MFATHMKAGQKFLCSCCKESHDEDEASFDDQFNGPVCAECRRNVILAVEYLKEQDIRRPLVKSDINQSNHKRFL